MNPDVIELQERAKHFALNHRVEANNSGSVCGDGRFTHQQSMGFLRAFGGDEGFEAAILGAQNRAINEGKVIKKFTPEELDKIYAEKIKVMRGEESETSVHTDEHNQIGCGFMRLAMEGIHNHLTADDASRLHQAALARLNGKQTVLNGEHEELAVLYVQSDKYSVDSRDESTGEMFFVVDLQRSKQLIEQIVPLIGIEGLTADDVWREFVSQMQKTAQQLAGGKEIFELNYNDNSQAEENFNIKLLGQVPMPAV